MDVMHKAKKPARKEPMIDNRKVKDKHQQGIKRVLQRKGDMEVGQGGKMHNGKGY